MFEHNYNFENGEVVCDFCEAENSYDGSFQECIDQIKEDGWLIRKIEDEWVHFCSKECYENYKDQYGT